MGITLGPSGETNSLGVKRDAHPKRERCGPKRSWFLSVRKTSSIGPKAIPHLDVVHPQRRLHPVAEPHLPSEDVQGVLVANHGVLLQAAGGVARTL